MMVSWAWILSDASEIYMLRIGLLLRTSSFSLYIISFIQRNPHFLLFITTSYMYTIASMAMRWLDMFFFTCLLPLMLCTVLNLFIISNVKFPSQDLQWNSLFRTKYMTLMKRPFLLTYTIQARSRRMSTTSQGGEHHLIWFLLSSVWY